VHTSLFDVLIKMMVALGIVLGGIRLVAAIAKRKGLPGLAGMTAGRGAAGRAARRPGMTVIAKQSLGKGIAVVAVGIGDSVLLLGVTPSNVSALGEIDALAFEACPDDLSTLQELAAPADDHMWESSRTVRVGARERAALPPESSTWMSKLDQLRDLTTRRS